MATSHTKGHSASASHPPKPPEHPHPPKPPEHPKQPDVHNELPDYFAKVKDADVQAAVRRATETGEEQRVDIPHDLPGSGTHGSITIFATLKGKNVRVWSPHMDLIESWFGHLKEEK